MKRSTTDDWTRTPTFVDTNILLYAEDRLATDKRHRAQDILRLLWKAHTGLISVQILCEWSVNLKRKAGLSWKEINRRLAPYQSWVVVVLDGKDVLEANRIADRYGISFWVSLVVRAAAVGGARTLLSEDLNHRQKIEGVEVFNPFLEGGR